MPSNKEYHKKYKQEYKKKVKYVNVAIPLEIYECLEKMAHVEETKVSTLMRKVAIEYLSQKPSLPKEAENDLKEVKFLIKNIANNVNQVAHHSNIIKGMVDEQGLLEYIKKLEDTVTSYTKGTLTR
jgi:hypothetical protein